MPFRGSVAVGLGLVSKDRLRGPDIVRLHRDVYVGAATEVDLRVCIQALDAWARGGGVIAGPLAALAYDAECPWEDREIVVAGRCRLPPDTVTVRTDRLRPEEVVERFGCSITSPVRTAFDLARRSPLVEAVAAVDSVAHACGLTPDHLRRVAERHPGARGMAQVRQILDLMDRLAESLPETRLRLGLLDRGVPAPVLQHRVTLLTGERKRLDLAWPVAMLALEYDGPTHRTIEGHNRDAFHRGRLGDLGWDVVVVTSAMIADPCAFDELAARVLRKLARGAAGSAR